MSLEHSNLMKFQIELTQNSRVGCLGHEERAKGTQLWLVTVNEAGTLGKAKLGGAWGHHSVCH